MVQKPLLTRQNIEVLQAVCLPRQLFKTPFPLDPWCPDFIQERNSSCLTVGRKEQTILCIGYRPAITKDLGLLHLGVVGHTRSSVSRNLYLGIHMLTFISVALAMCEEVGGGMGSSRATPSVWKHFKSSPFQDFSTACGTERLAFNYWVTRKRFKHLPKPNIYSYKVDSIPLLKVKGYSKCTLDCTHSCPQWD